MPDPSLARLLLDTNLRVLRAHVRRLHEAEQRQRVVLDDLEEELRDLAQAITWLETVLTITRAQEEGVPHADDTALIRFRAPYSRRSPPAALGGVPLEQLEHLAHVCHASFTTSRTGTGPWPRPWFEFSKGRSWQVAPPICARTGIAQTTCANWTAQDQ